MHIRLVCLALLLGACAPPSAGFDITATNAATTARYVRAGEGSGLLVFLEEQIDGEWRGLASNLAFMCTAECGIPGAIVCADVAAELSVVHALLPGDSVTKTWEANEWWWLDDAANCARRATLTGSMRATITHGPGAEDFNGAPLPEPAQSGVMDGEASVVDGVSEPLEFDLSAGTSIELELSE